MDNQKFNQPDQEEGWFDDILGKPQEPQQELGLDESAVFAAGLIHPADMELEKIITETKSMEESADIQADEPTPVIEAPADDPVDNVPDPHFHAPEPLTQEPFRDEEYRQAFGEGESLAAVFEEEIPLASVDTGVIPQAELSEEPELPPEPSQVEEEAPVRKRRPKTKKGYGLFGIPHILSTVVWVFVVFVVGVSLGRLIWVCAADVLAFGKQPKEAVISIYEKDELEDIARKLKNAGLIDYPELFIMYMEFSGNDEIQVGVHHLTPMIYDYHAIKTAMAPKTAAREVVEVVIPEGYNCAQVFALLEENGVCSVKELEDYAANGELNDYWFLEGVERGDRYCLEGYLFPDTYQFYKSHDPELVLEKMLDNFDYRFTDIMKEKIDSLNIRIAAALKNRGYDDTFIQEHKFTIREVVIVASMIERETANGSESYDISSVIFNRLTNPGNYPYLNIDATVIYGMGGAKIDPVTGDTLPLTQEDLLADTPYNSYTRKGLIPGPISNPGRNSLNAALDPNDTSYYYYVFDPSAGSHRFARNEEEHEANKRQVND